MSPDNISENTFYLWKRRYGSMETEDVKRLKELERENAQLKKLLAERDLEVDAVKTLLKKTVGDQGTARRCVGTNRRWHQSQTGL